MLDDKKAAREENKRKRDQAQGLDSASAGSSVNFTQPTGFPQLAHGAGIGEGAFPGGARVGEPEAFGVNGDGGAPGRGPAPGAKRGGKWGGAGGKAPGVQSERQAPFDGTHFVQALLARVRVPWHDIAPFPAMPWSTPLSSKAQVF